VICILLFEMFRNLCYILPLIFLIIVHINSAFRKSRTICRQNRFVDTPSSPIMQDKIQCIFEYERICNIFNEVSPLSFDFFLAVSPHEAY
jgi:hypothetical protein